MKKYPNYIYAILAIPLSILLRLALVPLIGYGIPYIMLFPVTVGVALLAGLRPAALTGFFGAVITDYFFIPPLYTIALDVPHITRLSVVVLTSVFVGYLGDRLKAARGKAEDHAESLLQSEERLKRSQEIAHLGSWELDLANNNLTWSDEVYRIFGLQPQEFGATYEAFLERVHPDDRNAVNEAYSGSIRDERDTYELEHRVVRKDNGKVRIVHEKCQHFRDEAGKIIKSVGMVHDITERRLMEDSLALAKKDWELTFDSVPDLIAIIDNNHRILRVNKPMAKKLGLEPEQCAGLPCYQYVHGLNAPPEFCPHSRTVEDGCFHATELREDRFGGDFLVTTNPLYDEQGKLLGSVHVAHDITERKKAEEEIKSLNHELERNVLELEAANRELETFSYSVSHDLRAPLRSIDGFSQALLEDYANKLDENGSDYLNRVRAATRQMAQLIDDMLNLSRVSRAEMKRDKVNLSDIAGMIANRLSRTQPERRVEFNIAQGLFANCDQRLLAIVLENLLSNSWKFTEKHSKAKIEFGQLRNAECGIKQMRDAKSIPKSTIRNPQSGLRIPK